MGPVLIDVPMNVQQAEAGDHIMLNISGDTLLDHPNPTYLTSLRNELESLLLFSRRPLVLFGAGVGLAGVEREVLKWVEDNTIPFVSSWNGQAYFNHDSNCYFGNIGVYGNRGANYILQNCDLLLSMGNRLDTRQRTPVRESFAAGAKVVVIDIDQAELDKFGNCDYVRRNLDLRWIPEVLKDLQARKIDIEWKDYLQEMKKRFFAKTPIDSVERDSSLNPNQIIRRINDLICEKSIVVVGIGAVGCWTYQSFHATKQLLFSSGGMAPMGYALCAGIGAALTDPDRTVVLIEGDGGFQLNIQELQTIIHHNLNMKIVILNNSGYGIIKQFQDQFFKGSYEASGHGLSFPNFEPIVRGYGFDYHNINALKDFQEWMFMRTGPAVIDVKLDPNTLIWPKTEMGHPINDQYPYVTDEEFEEANRFVSYQRISQQNDIA